MIVVVCGLGRCGTSLAMTMLAAGGFPVHGNPPDFEDGRILNLSSDASWLDEVEGRAFKLLDPHQNPLPPRALSGRVYVPIWMRRNFREQAKSQIKLLRLLRPDVRAPRRPALEAALGREHRQGLDALRLATGVAPAIFDFEDVIRYPIRAAARLAQVAAPLLPEGQRPDLDKMARWVAPRSPRCLDGFLELDLVEQFGAGS